METRVSRYGTGSASRRGRRWPFITIGLVLVGITVATMLAGNSNLGTYLPAVLGLPIALYGFFKEPLDAWFSHGAGRAVRWIFVAAYAVVAVVVGVSAVAVGSALAKTPAPGADAIIVLGAAVHGNEVTDTLEKRLNTAVDYYNASPQTLIVVTGGMGSGENVTEAEAMRSYLVSHGVPESSILVEDKASNTQENFQFSKKLLDAQLGRPAQIVYVTSDFHILRAGAEAKKAGFASAEGLGAPTPILTVPGAWLRESGALVRGLLRGDFEPA